MTVLLENMDSFALGFICILAIVLFVKNFVSKPYNKKIEDVSNWLVEAVKFSENRFGSKKGQQKLEFVYNLFTSKYPVLKLIISKKKFNILVDKALKIIDETIQEEINKNKQPK